MSNGADPLTQALVEGILKKSLDDIMRQRPGGERRVYLVAIVADGPHALKSHAYTSMPNVVAMQFADALEHEADCVRSSAEAGLMATAQAMVDSRSRSGG